MPGPTPLGSLTDDSRLFLTPRASGAGRPSRCAPVCEGLHTYLPDGTRVCWRPHATGLDASRAPGDATRTAGFAVDAELLSSPVPDSLGRGWRARRPDAPDADFWRDWTAAEVAAKLAATPIAVWLRRHPLGEPVPAGVELVHRVRGDAIVCFGRRVPGFAAASE